AASRRPTSRVGSRIDRRRSTARCQYLAMADGERSANVARVYRRLAAVEEKHAAFWERRLLGAGHAIGPRRPSRRARLLAWLARRVGAGVVLPTIAGAEYTQRNDYLGHPETHGTAMTEEERMHARVLAAVLAKSPAIDGGVLARIEGRHRNVGGNALRAAVLGANDGLSSNFSLIMGVAGAELSSQGILVTGLAGLLAGACSMAMGEWLSVQSSRELYQRQIAIEAEEIEQVPEEEQQELALIYEAKGLTEDEAQAIAAKLMAEKDSALDALA